MFNLGFQPQRSLNKIMELYKFGFTIDLFILLCDERLSTRNTFAPLHLSTTVPAGWHTNACSLVATALNQKLRVLALNPSWHRCFLVDNLSSHSNLPPQLLGEIGSDWILENTRKHKTILLKFTEGALILYFLILNLPLRKCVMYHSNLCHY